MTKGYLLKTIFSLSMLCTVVVAQEQVDAIEKARQAKEAADKAAAEAAAATSAAAGPARSDLSKVEVQQGHADDPPAGEG